MQATGLCHPRNVGTERKTILHTLTLENFLLSLPSCLSPGEALGFCEDRYIRANSEMDANSTLDLGFYPPIIVIIQAILGWFSPGTPKFLKVGSNHNNFVSCHF